MNINKIYKEQKVRWVKQTNNSIWVVAKDICSILGLTNNRRALQSLDPDYKSSAKFETAGGCQSLNIISETGMYTLIFKSRKKEAKDFQKWVFEEVLPAIRKTGKYELSEEKVELLRLVRAVELEEKLQIEYSEPPPGYERMTLEEQEECTREFEAAAKTMKNEDVYKPEFITIDIKDHPTYKYYEENCSDLIPFANM